MGILTFSPLSFKICDNNGLVIVLWTSQADFAEALLGHAIVARCEWDGQEGLTVGTGVAAVFTVTAERGVEVKIARIGDRIANPCVCGAAVVHEADHGGCARGNIGIDFENAEAGLGGANVRFASPTRTPWGGL